MTEYKCKECSGPAEMVDGKINRDCGHNEAGITADISATLYGVGSMQPPGQQDAHERQ
jgi:hypothetical protein